MVFYEDAGVQRNVRARTDLALLEPARRMPRDLALRLAELTSFFTVFSFRAPLATITRAASIDAALAAGTKDYCLIQTAGHLFYGYDPLSFAMNQALDACTFMTGSLRADGSLDPACVLVNRRAWEKQGRPSLSGILAPGHVAQPWDEAVRKAAWTCPVDQGDLFAWLHALDDVPAAPDDPVTAATTGFLRNIPDRADAPKKVFVFNSENDADLPQLRHRPGLDSAFVLASGFKANRILETLGFHDATKVITYDYSGPALALRKMMIAEWDGRDFAGFFANARPRIDAAFGHVGYLPPALIQDRDAVTREFQREVVSVFESEAQWLAHWQRFRKLTHVFVEADVITDRTAAKTMIAGHAKGHAVLWLSDMFNSPNAVGKFSWNRRRAAFDVIADSLRDHAASDLILGGPPALWIKP